MSESTSYVIPADIEANGQNFHIGYPELLSDR